MLNTANRLNEYNKKQKERAEYIERGEKKIQELFEDTIEKETLETLEEKTSN